MFFVLVLIMPMVLNVHNLKIYESLFLSLENNDQGLLIITSFKLVLMNAIRILPLYMSSYTLVVFLHDYFEEKRSSLYTLIGITIIPLTYYIIDLFFNIHYDFGITSIVLMVTIFVLVRNDFARIALMKKATFVIMMIIGLQWVDIVPGLTKYGFGKGEVSFDVKQAARFMGTENAVTLSATLFVIIFITNAIMILKLLKDQNTVIENMEATSRMEIELREAKLQSLRSRSLEEMQNLVHDLKSPLTSIQALVSLSEMMVEDDKVKGYMGKINQSVDQLNLMISEILHENKRHSTCIEDLMRSVLSHLLYTENDNIISYDNQVGDASIKINKIRFTRMIINLINNSLNAIDKDGKIRIVIYDTENELFFEIIDNGIGIEENLLSKIKEPGFSTKGSSGIGLRYVEDVVKSHGGTFTIGPFSNKGTRVVILFNKEIIKYEKNSCN
jgi:signal transduction histidine kinase